MQAITLLHTIHTSFPSFIHEKSKQSTLKPLIFANYPVGPIFNDFLWVCWFLCKNLSNFVYPVWKLHNPYFHTVYRTGMLPTELSGHLLEHVPNFKIIQSLPIYSLEKALISNFLPSFANICQVNSFEKRQLLW